MKLIGITNRKLCKCDFLHQLTEMAAGGVDGILLREKDLSAAAYETLVHQCLPICQAYHIPLILNTFWKTALAFQIPIQLPVPLLAQLPQEILAQLSFGVSVHHVKEAVLAERIGAQWLIAGHIYTTSCKEGVPPRGLAFLSEVCHAVSIPVFAIGGIQKSYLPELQQAGATGCCIMSQWMQTETPRKTLQDWKQSI